MTYKASETESVLGIVAVFGAGGAWLMAILASVSYASGDLTPRHIPMLFLTGGIPALIAIGAIIAIRSGRFRE